MTNYNERLDEVLERHGMYAVLKDANRFDDAAMEHEFPAEVGLDKTKQAITSLFKELVAEAKPYYCDGGEQCRCTTDTDRNMNVGMEIATRKFEQNLLKALEEV